MSTLETITQKLTQALRPTVIEVIDESHLHAGHSGARDGGESHFAVIVVSEKFKDLSIINRHKLIYNILSEELKTGVHALRIQASWPGV